MTIVREFEEKDIFEAVSIWNDVVNDGTAFPQIKELTPTEGLSFFSGQTYTGVSYDADSGEITGLYILHPNNIGRCAHICNASFAVKKGMRGRHIGQTLVEHCLETAKHVGFSIMQFNAVVTTNTYAVKLYEKLGFTRLGVIEKGFWLHDNEYSDIALFYKTL